MVFKDIYFIGGGLASEDLFLLDLRRGEENATWIIVKTSGPTPGKRYGHTMTYVKPYFVVFGGHVGNELLNDTWILSIEKVPFAWEKITMKRDPPLARDYHSAACCNIGTAAGMVVVFGGRSSDQNPLNDSWGLRKHRDGSWEWVKAPYKGTRVPSIRYQVC